MKPVNKLAVVIARSGGKYLASIGYEHESTSDFENLFRMIPRHNIVGLAFVLGNGADVNIRQLDGNKFTILMEAVYWAIVSNDLDVLEVVLATPGLDIDAGEDGETALALAEYYASLSSPEMAIKIVDMLKKAGATK